MGAARIRQYTGQPLTVGGYLHTLAYMTHAQFPRARLPTEPTLEWPTSSERHPVLAA